MALTTTPRWRGLGAVAAFAMSSAPRALATVAVAMSSEAAADVYSKVQGGSTCAEFGIPDVTNMTECFEQAAEAVGISHLNKAHINGISFSGCALNTAANTIFYSVSSVEQAAALPTLEYLCKGVPTTTTTVTSTASTGTTTTTSGVFAKLPPNVNCWDLGVPDVPSEETCFNTSVHFVGLVGVETFRLDSIGFTGCVWNNEAKKLLYSMSTWATPETNYKQASYEYVCNGIPATTTTTVSTTTTVLFTKFPANQNCAGASLPDVMSEEECFNTAAPYVGLGDKATTSIPELGFTGCIYNTAGDVVMYSETSSITPDTSLVLPTYEYICVSGGTPAPTVTTLPPLFP